MKRIFLFTALAIIITGFYQVAQNVYTQPSFTTGTDQLQILAATVQIRLKAPLLDESGQVVIADNNARRQVYKTAQGLGTLIKMGDQVQIVTHDHWGDLLLSAETVEFRDASGVLLLEMSGVSFRKLLRYQDPGTLLLQSPAELAPYWGQALETSQNQLLAAGSEVFLVRREPEHDGVEVVAAKVTVISQHEGLPIYILQTLDGTPIVEGDSGGGIWFHKQLVGNMWWTVVKETVATTHIQETVAQETPTAKSVAATFTEIACPLITDEMESDVLP